MHYQFFSKNGQVLPIEQAVVSVDNIAYAYGFGVYETIRVNKGIIYFTEEHLERLQQSALAVGIEHSFKNTFIAAAINELVKTNQAETCNLKILLVGGATTDQAELYILCLNPLFPDRKLYAHGAKMITYNAERPFPHAKSLNMLQSYIAYKKAKKSDAYDALLVDRLGNITEGTRTNFFAMKGTAIVSPPEDTILLGVMRKVVLKVASQNNFDVQYAAIPLADLDQFDAAFVTSTSSKIMPIKSIDNHAFADVSSELRRLMSQTQEFLVNCKGQLS